MSAWQTLKIVFRNKYDVVFAQAPSILLTCLVALLKCLRRFTFVIDAHNIVLEQAVSGGLAERKISKFAFKSADHVMVSNDNLASNVKKLGGTPLVLPDRIPNIPYRRFPERFSRDGRSVITLISSFGSDEPIGSFLESIDQVAEEFVVFVTGKRSKAKAKDLLRYESERVTFTDFLSEEEFEGLIQHSDLLVDLTTREDCLVCGAYEALAVGVPILLSDTAALQATFPKGCVFSKDDPSEYGRTISSFFRNQKAKKKEMIEFKKEFTVRWDRHFRSAQEAIGLADRAQQATRLLPTL